MTDARAFSIDSRVSPLAPSQGFDLFDVTPVPLWIEDFSGVRALFKAWRAEGVEDIASFLGEDVERVRQCSAAIRVLDVNAATLALFEADDLDHLRANLHRVFSEEMLESHVQELGQLWDGAAEFTSRAVNYTLSGRRLDVQLKGRLLPGHETDWRRVLVATEDVTARENALRLSARAESYALGLFEHSPISLWVEDFSVVKALIDEVRRQGVVDFRTFTDVHPEFVKRCMREIRVVEVNQHTLDLFRAPDRTMLLRRISDIFRDGMHIHFREQLIDLWNGKLFQQREVVNYSLDGDELHVHMQFSVFPGREHDWSQVQVALTDITARKKAESYLEYLGKHDVLTKLFNRSFYVDELNRLERMGPFPVTVLIADLNGLKPINDTLGHAAGDALLRRAGEVLNEVVGKTRHAARIGGDEFAILMPSTDEAEGLALLENLGSLVELNNQFYPGSPLSFAAGIATCRQGERLEDAVRRADLAMYEDKRRHYASNPADRRTQ